jgi:hypothetical protein
MSLKASELTDKIDAAFADEWRKTKPIPLPSAGAEDRRLLFAAVAHGVLAYLKENDDEIFKTLSLRIPGGATTNYDVTAAELDLAAD